MLTPAQFRAAFPAFADATVWTDDVVSAAYALSAPNFDTVAWGLFIDQGQGYWVAWQLSVNPPSGAAGTANTNGDVTSKTVGRENIQRASELLKAEMDNPYLKNDYGRMYLFLANQRGVGAVSVVGCSPFPLGLFY